MSCEIDFKDEIIKIRNKAQRYDAYMTSIGRLLCAIGGVLFTLSTINSLVFGYEFNFFLFVLSVSLLYVGFSMSIVKDFWAVPGIKDSVGLLQVNEKNAVQLGILRGYSEKTSNLYDTAMKALGGKLRLGWFIELRTDLLDIIELEEWAKSKKISKSSL